VADEVGAGLRSGASLRQALESASNRGGAAGETLRAVLIPVARGDPLARAADRWARTAVGEPDEALLAEAVELASTAARADPVLFDVVADTIRDRAAIAGELRAQTAQARASALALSVLPLAFTGLLAFTDPGVVAFLLGTVGGWLCLTVGLTLQAAGGWWMHRIVTEAGR
jgi:tight adherence protein B